MEQTKKCRGCYSDIPVKAKKCPSCRSDQRSWARRHPIMTFLLVIVGFGFVMSSAINGLSGPSEEVQQAQGPKVPDTTEVCVEASMLIEKTLKAPSTAKFPTCSHFIIENLPERGYKVSSYVDSQNGFGAMIRTEWTIVFYYVGDGFTRTDRVVIDGETVYERQ